MKFAFVLFALLGIAYGSTLKIQDPSDTAILSDLIVIKNLSADMDDFKKLFPREEFAAILMKYMEDSEFQIVLFFLFGDQFADLYNTLHSIPEFIEFWDYLIDEGLDMNRYDQAIRDYLNIPFQPQRLTKETIGGVNGFIREVIDILPIDEIRALALEKLETSEAFRDLYNNLRSEEFQNIVRALRAEPTYQFIVEYLEIFGINVEAVANFIMRIFGWDL